MTEIVYSAICWPGGDTFSLSPPSSRRHFLGRNRGSFLEPQLNIKPKRPVPAPCFGGIDLTRFAGRRKLKQLLVAWQEPMAAVAWCMLSNPKSYFYLRMWVLPWLSGRSTPLTDMWCRVVSRAAANLLKSSISLTMLDPMGSSPDICESSTKSFHESLTALPPNSVSYPRFEDDSGWVRYLGICLPSRKIYLQGFISKSSWQIKQGSNFAPSKQGFLRNFLPLAFQLARSTVTNLETYLKLNLFIKFGNFRFHFQL